MYLPLGLCCLLESCIPSNRLAMKLTISSANLVDQLWRGPACVAVHWQASSVPYIWLVSPPLCKTRQREFTTAHIVHGQAIFCLCLTPLDLSHILELCSDPNYQAKSSADIMVITHRATQAWPVAASSWIPTFDLGQQSDVITCVWWGDQKLEVMPLSCIK